MEENKNLVVYVEHVWDKIKNFVKKIFNRDSKSNFETETAVENIQETNSTGKTKKKFNEYISFKENKEELDMINSIRENPEKLKEISMEELKEVENAIRNRQNFVDKKIAKLKTDLAMKKA